MPRHDESPCRQRRLLPHALIDSAHDQWNKVEPGAGSKTLVLRDTEEGWKFSVKSVPPIVRERNTKSV